MLILPFVAAVGFGLILAAALFLGGRSQLALREIERGHYPAVELSRDLEDLLEQIQRQLRDAVSLQDEEEFARADVLRDAFLERVRASEHNPVQEARHAVALARTFESYYALAQRISRRLMSGNVDEDLAAELETMRGRYNAIRASLEANSDGSRHAIRAAFSTAEQAQRALMIATMSTLLFCMLAMLLAARMVANGVTRPIADAMRITRSLSDGDLTVEIDPTLAADVSPGSRDEVRSLLDALAGMALRLATLVQGVHGHTRAVGSLATNLSEASRDMKRGSESQRQAVGEATHSLSLVSESVRGVTQSVDEVSTLAQHASAELGGMDSSLNAVVGLIDRHTGRLDEAVAAVAETTAVAGQIAGAAEHLNRSADASSRSLRALTESVHDVEERAKRTSQLSREMHSRAENGMNKVEETCASMDDIYANYQRIDVVVANLFEKSRAIGEINEVIEGVLAQTHLLALNATIISAQAGEHGRGFAVVAQQISSLADQTTVSTRQIRTLIEGVQREVEGAVDAMKGGSQRIELGVSRSNEAGKLLEEIRKSAAVCTTNVDEIVEVTIGQSTEIASTNESMGELRDVARQLDEATGEQARSSERIRDVMEELRDLGHHVTSAGHEQRRGSQAVTTAVDELATRIRTIAGAATSQGEMGSRISRAVETFEEAVSEGASRAESMYDAVRVLLERSEELEAEVSRFRV